MYSERGNRIKDLLHNAMHLLSVKGIKRLLGDSYYSSSAYIILSFLVSSGVGLLFWIVAAQIYSENEVGLATSIISLIGLIVAVSRLGLDQSLIRFFPDGDRSKILSTTLIVTTGASVVIGIVCMGTASIWSPALATIGGEGALVFIALIALQCMSLIIGNAFVALRKAKLNLTLNVILASRLAIMLPLVTLGAVGLLFSWALSYAMAILVSIYLLYVLGISLKKIDRSFLKSSYSYSAGNYVSDTLNNIPGFVLPLLVLNQLGVGASANYYIAYSLSNIASIILVASNTSLFVEGSYGEGLRKMVIKSTIVSVGLLVPVTIGVYLGGGFLLGLLGKGYATGGLELLQLLLISNIFYIPYLTYYTILKVQKNLRMLIVQGALNCVLVLVLSYYMMGAYGLNGTGYAWIVAYLVLAAIIALIFIGKSSLSKKERSSSSS